jgi:HrpA-like RNA helicase
MYWGIVWLGTLLVLQAWSDGKIIVMTNVGEASLTFPHVQCVFDTGVEKVCVRHPAHGMLYVP